MSGINVALISKLITSSSRTREQRIWWKCEGNMCTDGVKHETVNIEYMHCRTRLGAVE